MSYEVDFAADRYFLILRNPCSLWFGVYPKCHFVFLINWNMKLEIKFWFSFLYWSWDRKHQNKWFSDFRNNWTLKFKFEVCFSFFILISKTKNQIHLNKATSITWTRNLDPDPKNLDPEKLEINVGFKNMSDFR